MKKYPVIRRGLDGGLLQENRPPPCAAPVVSLPGTPYPLMLDRDTLARGLLILGATGTGKTFLTNRLAKELRDALSEPYSMVILDVKGDYTSLLRPGDLVLGQDACSVKWNLFHDLTFDGWEDTVLRQNTQEFCRQLFAGKENQAQQFFPDAARLLLEQVILSYLAQAKGSLAARRQLSNNGLVNFFKQFDQTEYQAFLARCPDPGIVRLLLGDPPSSTQALGVLAETVITVLDSFCDIFGQEGEFSVRRFIQDKKRQALLLQIDPAYQATQQRLYGILMSSLLKEVLSQKNKDGTVILVCDELHSLGKVGLLPSAVNLGRDKGLIFMAGLQSIDQLNSAYGSEDANVLLSGMRTKLCFQPNDGASRAFVRDTFGTVQAEEIRLSRGGNHIRTIETPVVSDHDLQRLGLGECLVSISGSPPFFYHYTL